MPIIRDYRGIDIRITEERLRHLRETHPEMLANESEIGLTLAEPQEVVQSTSDDRARLYYRRFDVTGLGSKLMCVLVLEGESPFVLTAYFTDRVKKGVVLWPSE
jgi:hypothetical protein